MKILKARGDDSLWCFLWQELPLKHPKRAQDVRWTSALRGPEWNGDAAARCHRQRSMRISGVHEIICVTRTEHLDFPRGLEYNYCDYM